MDEIFVLKIQFGEFQIGFGALGGIFLVVGQRLVEIVDAAGALAVLQGDVGQHVINQVAVLVILFFPDEFFEGGGRFLAAHLPVHPAGLDEAHVGIEQHLVVGFAFQYGVVCGIGLFGIA